MKRTILHGGMKEAMSQTIARMGWCLHGIVRCCMYGSTADVLQTVALVG